MLSTNKPTSPSSQQQPPSSSLLTSSTAYTLLNALIKILSNSEKISRKQQQQIDYLINYWKNFDSKSIQRNLNEFKKLETDELNKQYNEILNEIKKSVLNEDSQKKSISILKSFQVELDSLSKRVKINETVFYDMNKVLLNIPDPLPLIELIINLNSDFNDKFEKFETENKQLRETLDEFTSEMNIINRQESKQSEKDKELIKQLYEQISKTTSLNLDLNARLEVAESEIESYKKILSNYQNKISEMKIKCFEDNNNNNNNCSSSNPLTTSSPTTSSSSTSNANCLIHENDKTKNKQLLQNTTTNNNHRSSNNLLIASTDTTKQQQLDNLMNKWNNQTTPTTTINNKSPNTSISQFTSWSLKNLLNKDKLEIEINNNNNGCYNTESQLSPTPSTSPIVQHNDENNNNVLNYEPLNTSDIAQRVRDLLSLHNIGQRIFAKYILGLSQGTVSELLSKPKHWDKLTEKGRESYRKMHTWSQSDDSINALKAISPRKGNKDNYFYQNGGKEDSATEERIVQILNEAQKQMQKNTNLQVSSSKPQLNDNNFQQGKYPLDIENQKQFLLEQLKKFKHLVPTSNHIEQQNNEIKTEETEYDDETIYDDNQGNDENDDDNTNQSDINNNINTIYKNDPLDLTLKTSSSSTTNEIKVNSMKRQYSYESGLNLNNDNGQHQQHHHSSQQHQYNDIKIKKLATPAIVNNLTISSASSTSSTSTSPSPTLNGSNMYSNSSNFNKPLKSVLPPVSQEQFDKYSFINTEDLVKRVKDLLSKYSISQRLFGEYILGLSQGSVSDLLARPKPWMMLTQKGREPFIRMQIFIDDNDAIKKLMTNQYKIPSDKFVQRVLPFNQPQPPLSTTPSSYASQLNANGSFSQSNDNSNDDLTMMSNSNKNDLNNNNNNKQLISTSNHHQTFQTQLNIIPYDISTLTTSINDINTDEITNKVKETLLNNNIGQKLFGEAVLNLSQGTVSELLSKPKPWNTLSIKGREPYLRMYMWLNDSQRLEKLNEWKEERNTLKRTNTEVENDQQKPKRRFIFTEDQKDQLMKAFRFDPYPSVNQMELLAGMLNLATRTVINWFHNHRMRIRYKNTSSTTNSNNLHRQSPHQHPPQQNQNNSKFSLEHYTAMSKQKYSNSNPYNSLNGSLKTMNTNSNNSKYGLNYESSKNDEYNDDVNDDEMMDDDYYDNDASTNGNHVYDDQNVDDIVSDLENNNNNDDDDDEDLDDDDNNQSQIENQNDINNNNEINSLFIDPNSSSEKYHSEDSNDSIDTKTNFNRGQIGSYNNNNNNNSQYNNSLNLNSTRSNKRRKPDNPQKLTQNNANNQNIKVDVVSNKLLNIKKQTEDDNERNDDEEEEEEEGDEESDVESNETSNEEMTTTTTTNVTNCEQHQINDNIVVH